MRFSKWHALGNSYLVVERSAVGHPLEAAEATRLCDEGLGVGAHGVLEVAGLEDAAAEVVIWNPDGSVAEMSGNGTRIAAAWLARRTGADVVTIRTAGREVRARLRVDGLIEQELGPVRVDPLEVIDVHGNPVEVVPVDVGNPHAVIPCAEPARETLLRLGPLVETHHRFPARTNVQLAHADGRHDVHALVWERGAGETPASGSSAVAVAAAALAQGWCDSPVTVHMPGGRLEVRFTDGATTLVGPAEPICDVDAPPAGGGPGALAWIDLTVADADGLRDFYVDVLGWRPHGVEMGGYEDWALCTPDGQAVAGICHARGPNAELPPVWIPYWAVPHVADAVARAERRGARLLRPAAEGTPYAVLSDPGGTPFALFERR